MFATGVVSAFTSAQMTVPTISKMAGISADDIDSSLNIQVEKSVDVDSLELSINISDPVEDNLSSDLICSPLKTLDEVTNWVSTIPHPDWAKKVVRLKPKSKLCSSGINVKPSVAADGSECIPLTRSNHSSVPKTLFCHDYKGGYTDDRFVNGTVNYNEYRFFHWAGIDTFVYFSHYFVTIPPLVWINAGHRNGVKVLGTLITEWKDGMAIWEKILESKENIDIFASNLAIISQYFGFEGYLLNIENEVKREHIDKLVYFVRLLRHKLRAVVPEGEIIWYDSVTVDGLLKWQNQLNNNNRPFFDACDGIFLNYGWREEDLLKSVANAGLRVLDVYVGVDVFGRGVYGGGGFNTDKAMALLRKHNLSAALFAPGWVHETQPAAHFTSLEYLFWQKVWPYLYVRGPCQLPFETSFCQGYGLAKYRQGVGMPGPWYNLDKQAYQPSVPSDLNETCLSLRVNQQISLPDSAVSGCVEHCSDDGFNGGGCLRIKRPSHFAVVAKEFCSYQRLFVCCFESDYSVMISCATKVACEQTYFNLVLVLEDSWGKYRKVTLTDDVSYENHPDDPKAMGRDEIIPFITEQKLDINPYGNNGWKQSFFRFGLNRGKIVEIGTEIKGNASCVLLGQLQIIPIKHADEIINI